MTVAESAGVPGAPPAVLLAEPDEPTRVGLRMALQSGGFAVCAEPANAVAVIASAAVRQPAICLLSDALPGGVLTAVAGVLRGDPAIEVLLLVGSEDPPGLLSALQAGASGCVRTDLDPMRLPDTLSGVLNGEAALSRLMTRRLLERWRTRARGRDLPTVAGAGPVSERELEALELLADGMVTGEIASRLSISEVTVRRHLSAVVAKLGVSDRGAAIAVLRR